METDMTDTMTKQEPSSDQRRIADLEAQLAEARQDKDRLLRLLDTALATISSQDQRISHLERLEAKFLDALPPQRPLPEPTRRPQPTSAEVKKVSNAPEDSWEKLKRWFFNA